MEAAAKIKTIKIFIITISMTQTKRIFLVKFRPLKIKPQKNK